MKKFAKLMGKHLCWSLFFIKLQPYNLQSYEKETLVRCSAIIFVKLFRTFFLQKSFLILYDPLTYNTGADVQTWAKERWYIEHYCKSLRFHKLERELLLCKKIIELFDRVRKPFRNLEFKICSLKLSSKFKLFIKKQTNEKI